MKRKLFTLLMSCIVSGMLFWGCSNGIEEKDVFEGRSSMSKTYVSMINLQKNAAEAGVEVVSKYTDIKLDSCRAANGFVDFNDIGSYLPNDLSSLKRTVDTGTRNGAKEEVTLEEELAEIAENFTSDFEALLPDPSKALTLPFVSESEDGLVIGGDAVIPYKSIGGAVAVELLNAIANGEDVEKLLAEFEEDISNIFDKDNSRSLWHVNTVTWVNGVINYRWGEISEAHKDALRVAMNKWSNRTFGEVSFCELEDNGWNNFQLAIHAIGCVTLQDADLGENVRGNSTVGYLSGNQCRLNLNRGLTGLDLERGAVHELGHVLGLQHEHQRFDRDDYINIPDYCLSDTTNYGIIPREISNFRWGVQSLRIGWWTINIYYPIWWNSTNSYVEGTFDFKSVMLYDWFTVKTDKAYLNGGKTKIDTNVIPSDSDVRMIINRY